MRVSLIRDFRERLGEALLGHREELPFIIFVSFLLTFLLSRLSVWLVIHHLLPGWLFVYSHGVHIHHFNYGIILLALTGFWGLINTRQDRLYLIAILYGIGLGLTADEYGMILLLRDNYYVRESYDAVTVVAALLLSAIYFKPFWRKLGGIIMEVFRG
jgi:hypothetical protein